MNRTNKLKKRLAVGALIAGVATVGCLRAGATPITVLNSDFSNYAQTYLQNNNAAVSGYAGRPADWTVSDPGDAFVQPDSFNYAVLHNGNKPFTYYGVILFGQYANTVLSQQTTYDASLGETFTLSSKFFEAWSNLGAQLTSGDIALTIGGHVVAENTGIGALTSFGPGDGSAANITLSYIVTDPNLVGKTVGIELLTPSNTQYYYDNVGLDVVPEPSTWAMLFAGLVSLIGWQRRRRPAQD